MLSVDKDQYMFELKYRPPSIDECILPAADKKTFKDLIKRGKFPHLILHSNSPGTGKTTVARALCNEIDADYIFVNGSGIGIDFIKNELTQFASSKSLEGKQKVVILDEFDRPQLVEAQKYLRSFMEAYGSNCSIIITANNLEGIIPHLQSRATVIKFGQPRPEDVGPMMKEMLVRCIKICENEGIEVTEKRVLAALVKKNFPNFRNTLTQLDKYGVGGKIDEGILSIIMDERGSIDDVIDSLKSGDFSTLRKLAPKYAPDYPSFIEKLINELYTRLDKASIIRMYEIIGENNQTYGIAANAEIHIMYMFVQLLREMKWN